MKRHPWFKHNPRKAEVVLGLSIIGGAIVLGHLNECRWVEWLVIEPLKAVGGAPICKLICEALEWEA